MKSVSFRSLWIGQAFANLGDVFYIVGMISMMYSVSQSAFFLALLPFINTVGRFTSGYLSPLLFDKYRLKSLLCFSQISKTVVFFGLALWLTWTDGVFSFVLFGVFLLAFLDGWADPASRAMLPRLVGKEEIVRANSLFSVVSQVIQLGGWALGGVLVAWLGGRSVLWITFLLFVVASGLMLLIRDRTNVAVGTGEAPAASVLKRGWQAIWQTPVFRSIHIVLFLESMANVVWIAAIIYVFVSEVLDKSEAWWGYINTTFFIGLLLGGLLTAVYARLMERHLFRMLLWSAIAVSIFTVVFGLNRAAIMALVLSVLFGICEQIKSIAMETYLQKKAEPEDLPNIYGAQGALTSLTFGIASLAMGALAEAFGVQSVFLLAGGLLAASAGYLFFMRGRFLVTLKSEHQEEKTV